MVTCMKEFSVIGTIDDIKLLKRSWAFRDTVPLDICDN